MIRPAASRSIYRFCPATQSRWGFVAVSPSEYSSGWRGEKKIIVTRCKFDRGHKAFHKGFRGRHWSHWPTAGYWKRAHFELCTCGSRFVDHIEMSYGRALKGKLVCVAPGCAPSCGCRGFKSSGKYAERQPAPAPAEIPAKSVKSTDHEAHRGL